MRQTTKYRIADYTEETNCDWCGRPLYVGDRARITSDEVFVFCSPQCETGMRDLELRESEAA